MNDEITKHSEEFETAFTGGGTVAADCGFCGRTHFASLHPSDFDEGELEGLRARAEADPDKCIEHAYSSISVGWLAGTQFVADCDCGKALNYERFIVAHRHQITRFLKARAQKIKKQAESEVNDAAELSEAG